MSIVAETLAQAARYHMAGQLPEAEQLCLEVLRADSANVEAINLLGVVLATRGDSAAALECFRRALLLSPNFAQAHCNLGVALNRQGNLAEATDCYRRALQLKPNYAVAQFNLGVVLEKQGELEVAAESYRRALQLKPDFAEVHSNLGVVLEKQGDLDAAAECHHRALHLRPDFAQAHSNLGAVMEKQGDLEAAAKRFRRALALQPSCVDGHIGLAVTLLRQGDFAEGWRQYEWRFKREGASEEALVQPRWTGSPLKDRTILLRCEQGLGDILQFVRYAMPVKQQGGTVLVECPAALASLLARCSGVDRVFVKGEALPEFDVYLPLLSLPGVFHTSPETIPARVPYLWPASELVNQWQQELGPPTALKVGIAWQGDPANRADRFRSIPLMQFAPLADLPAVRLYSLQMGPGREQLTQASWPIVDLGDRLGDFHNTAAIVRNLDLVVTCDSSPAHLAGALGVPVWVALAYVPDWRWLLDRDDSPWYPTMRLIRQTQPGDWQGVFQRIQDALARFKRSASSEHSIPGGPFLPTQ